MTVILGVVDKKNKSVHIMGDSMVSLGERNYKSINKIWKDNSFVIGCAGSLSAMQLLKRSINFPSEKTIEENDIKIDINFIVNNLCPAIRNVIQNNKSGLGDKPFMEILIAYKEDLYSISPYFEVFKIDNICSTGSGSDHAEIAYIHSTIQDTEKRMFEVIKYATTKIRSCGMPAYYINTEEMQFKKYDENGHWNYAQEEQQW